MIKRDRLENTEMKAFIAAAALSLAAPPLLAEITVSDAYARASNTKAGAAFMVIENSADEADRLIDARATVSARVELHTHKENGDGIMQMIHVKDGFEIPAGGKHMLMRGGDHVMFMGLNAPFEQGATIPVTLVFEKAGEVAVDVIVDLQRKPQHGMMKHDH
jgi:copper(I)-binding protein